jgi:hypothetical protein
MSKFISTQQLVDGLRAQRGARPVTIEARTKPATCKHAADGRVNPFTGLIKVSVVNGIANWHYEPAVNRQREREGKPVDFEALPRKWGNREKGSPLVEHKGKLYLELKVEKSLGHRYFENGVEVPAEEVEPFLRPASKSRQEVDREIILRDYSITSIEAATINGERYKVIHA